jgi:putative transposase
VHRRRRGKYGRRSVSTATAPDRVERNFTASGPNELWVADISYLRSWEGFVYLAVVVDAFSRKVVGWRWPTTCAPNSSSTRSGWRSPPASRRPARCTTPIESAQYTSYEFGKALRASGLLASMGRVGSAFDNSMAESVFATLKTELIDRRSWPTRHELKMEVFSYLEGFYNTRRRHSRLNNLSPTDYENMHLTQNEVSA